MFFYLYYNNRSKTHVHLEDGSCPCGFEAQNGTGDESTEKYTYVEMEGYKENFLWSKHPHHTAWLSTFAPIENKVGCKKCIAYIKSNIKSFTKKF
jgi:hypothetical protein